MSLDNVQNTKQTNIPLTTAPETPKQKSPRDIVVFNFNNAFGDSLSLNKDNPNAPDGSGLTAEEFALLDKNKDGSISLGEVSTYVKSGQNLSEKIMEKLATLFGFEDIKTKGFAQDQKLINHITNMSNVMKAADKDHNGELTVQEIQDYNKLGNVSRKNKNELNEMFGIKDSRIDNEQGNYGDCWLLSSLKGLSTKDRKLYNEIIKYDANSDSYNITLKGLIDPDTNQPVTVSVSRQDVMKAIQERTKGENAYNRGKYLYTQEQKAKGVNESDIYYEPATESEYGSNDPDAVAFELAFKSLQGKQQQYDNLYKDSFKSYIQNTKFDTGKISTTMDRETLNGLELYIKNTELTEEFKSTLSEEELKAFNELKMFTKFKSSNLPGNTMSMYQKHFNFTEEQVTLMKKYIDNSQWNDEITGLKEYTNEKIDFSHGIICTYEDFDDPIYKSITQMESYLKHTNLKNPDGATAPKLVQIPVLDDGFNEIRGLNLLTGARYDSYTFDEVGNNTKQATLSTSYKIVSSSSETGDEKITLNEKSTKNKIKQFILSKLATKNPCFTGFKNYDGVVLPQHAYQVLGMDENNNVLLSNPHDSTKIEKYPFNKFINNVASFDVSDLNSLNS